MRRKFGSALEAIRQEWALSSKETVPVVSPALLVKFVIFVDIQDLTKKAPHIGRLTFPLWGVFLGLNSTPAIAAPDVPF